MFTVATILRALAPKLRRRCLASLCTVIGTLLLACQTQASPITIDNFADPDPEAFGIMGSASPFTHSVTGSAGVLGGDRDYTANWIGEVTIPFGSATSIGEGRLRLATFAPTDKVKVTLDYPNVGGADITSGGANDRFQLDFLFIEGGSSSTLSLDISVTTSSGVGSFVGAIPESPAAATSFLAHFADFSGTYDFSDVLSISIVFNNANATAVDFELNRPIITTGDPTAPEPASASLAICGLVFGAVALRRRGARRRGATESTSMKTPIT